MKLFPFTLLLLLCLNSQASNNLVIEPAAFLPCGVWPTNMTYNPVNDLFEFDLEGTCGEEVWTFEIWINGELVHSGPGSIGDHITFTIPGHVFNSKKNGDCIFLIECATTTGETSYRDGCIVVVDGCLHGNFGPW